MAERGRTSPLDSEIRQAIAGGRADELLLGDPIANSPGRARIEFEASVDQPFVTLVSMVAPSPDWFVGVSALPLLDGGDWAQRIDVELFAYDAGTDGGRVYTAANRPLAAREPIRRIERAPFVVDGALTPLGTFTFRRVE
jgi:hypothetical protein